VKERPILMSAPMVQALLAGTKVQTRRVIKPDWWRCLDPEDDEDRSQALGMCPYGQVGDRLIVKEAAWMWCEKRPDGTTETGRPKWLFVPLESAPVIYCADHPSKPGTSVVSPDTGNAWGWRMKLGRYLPRSASRITLEITEVRIQRLHEISEDDAKAEGFPLPPYRGTVNGRPATIALSSPKLGFKALWLELNGHRPGCWDTNPHVWAVSFRRLPSDQARGAA
jgi:hypothetical protein